MRRFRCTACGRQPAPGETVPLVGVLVRRRRRRASGGWHEVEVLATPRFPARACPPCAARFPGRLRAAA